MVRKENSLLTQEQEVNISVLRRYELYVLIDTNSQCNVLQLLEPVNILKINLAIKHDLIVVYHLNLVLIFICSVQPPG